MDSAAPGEIVTFYSYKGGTGRSMALANLACLLAQRTVRKGTRGVVVVDWDLEAPGLHRFFRGLFKRSLGDDATFEKRFDSRPGLLDLLLEFQSSVAKLPTPEREPDASAETFLRESVAVEQFILSSDLEGLHFLKAGFFDEKYPEKVNTFPWEEFYRQAPWFFPWFVNLLAQRYQYVLIDSRTGVTDTSGICTMLVPDKLVVVFTPNLQNLEGVLGLVERATHYRKQSDDLRPLIVLPLPSRIEPARPTLRDQWRYDHKIGYQSRFQQLFKSIYDLPECNLKAYFDDVPIYQVPDYAYGEEIAVLVELGGDKLSLSRSYETFLDWLESSSYPWEGLDESAQPSLADDVLARAQLTLAQLTTEEEVNFRKVLGRLVLPGVNAATDSRLRLPVSDLDPEILETVESLRESGIVVLSEAGGSTNVELAHDILISRPPLRNWLDEDRAFLSWRRGLEIGSRDWQSAFRDKGLLLQGRVLKEAETWLAKCPEYFTHLERSFVQQSVLFRDQVEQRSRRRRSMTFFFAGILLAATVAIIAWLSLRKDPVTQLTDLGWQVQRTDTGMYLQFNGTPPAQSLKALRRISLPLGIKLGGIDSNISGWSVLKNLTALDLSDTEVTDVWPLMDLKSLSTLRLNRTYVSNTSPLQDLTNLTTLDLSFTKVYDVSPMRDLKNLTWLSLSQTKVSDISPLKNLKNMVTLGLWGTPITDVSPLMDLKNLTTLYLKETAVSDVAPLKDLTKLTSLDLSLTLVSDLSPMKDLSSLAELNLSYTNVRDLSPLKRLKSLTTLNLYDTKVTDVSPLKDLTNLTTLNLAYTKVSDVSALKDLTHMTTLNLTNTKVSNVSALKGIPNLEIVR